MTHQLRALAAPLLLLQAGLSLLAAVGLLIYARASNALGLLAGPELLALGGPLTLVVLALGVGRGWRWACRVTIGWEALTLLGTAVSLLASRGASLSLTLALSGLALPVAIVFLVLRRDTRSHALRTQLTAVLLLLTGFVHIALVADHLREAPVLGILFAADGAALVFLALSCRRFAGTGWHRSAAAVLLATILAYLAMLASQREAVDDLGLATKLIELAALALVIWPVGASFSRRWVAAGLSLVLTIVLSGSLAWAASFRPTPSGHAHAPRDAVAAAAPTDAERSAADKLVEDTRLGIERYADVQAALADGYRPSTPPRAPTVHYMNPAFRHADHVLDPGRPQALVYATTVHGPVLLGAMYMLPSANRAPPDVGGPLVEWHTHANLCFSVPSWSIDGLETPFGTCPVGSISAPTPAMLHVWTVANPSGPFAADVSPAILQRLNNN